MAQQEYDPKASRDRLLAAVQEQKWLPILRSPFDFTEENPRFEEAIKPAMEILGRLAITLHVAYEEACKSGFPLFLSDSSKRKVQYAIADVNPGFYHLVFFQGEEEHKQKFCSLAKAVLVPEVILEEANKKFLYHPKIKKDGSFDGATHDIYLPYFEGEYGIPHYINGVSHSILVGFNRDHQIRSVSAAYSNGAFQSYYFLEERDFRIRYIQPPHSNWSIAFDDVQRVSLNRDGIFRYDDGTTREVDLAGELLEITSQLPIEHHIR